jgi:creatinine amidohydrolase
MRTRWILGLTLCTATAASAQSASAPSNKDRGGGSCAANTWNCADTPNPFARPNTVWLEEMTWMDVRDAMAAGTRTIIIPTGGMEPNGPFLAIGKHNYVLQGNCEAIARRLGNALCAPILKFVPEGPVDGAATGHMNTPGTMSLSEETYRTVLTELVRNLKAGGFENILLIGDSGGNQGGQAAVAEALTKQWKGHPVVAHIPEYYTYAAAADFMKTRGLTSTRSDNLHDDPIITLNMFYTNPETVRWSQRVEKGLATIDGVSIADRAASLERAAAIVDFRTDYTIKAIKNAIAQGATSQY